MKSLSTIMLLLLLPCMPACKLAGMYDQEYVFYDPAGEAEAAAEAEAGAEAAAEAENALPPPQTRIPAEAGADASTGGLDLNRLFQLEAVLDELNRAIRDGLDYDGSIAIKREEVGAELARHKREAGEAYGQERRRRLQALRDFAIHKDG